MLVFIILGPDLYLCGSEMPLNFSYVAFGQVINLFL